MQAEAPKMNGLYLYLCVTKSIIILIKGYFLDYFDWSLFGINEALRQDSWC